MRWQARRPRAARRDRPGSGALFDAERHVERDRLDLLGAIVPAVGHCDPVDGSLLGRPWDSTGALGVRLLRPSFTRRRTVSSGRLRTERLPVGVDRVLVVVGWLAGGCGHGKMRGGADRSASDDAPGAAAARRTHTASTRELRPPICRREASSGKNPALLLDQRRPRGALPPVPRRLLPLDADAPQQPALATPIAIEQLPARQRKRRRVRGRAGAPHEQL